MYLYVYMDINKYCIHIYEMQRGTGSGLHVQLRRHKFALHSFQVEIYYRTWPHNPPTHMSIKEGEARVNVNQAQIQKNISTQKKCFFFLFVLFFFFTLFSSMKINKKIRTVYIVISRNYCKNFIECGASSASSIGIASWLY